MGEGLTIWRSFSVRHAMPCETVFEVWFAVFGLTYGQVIQSKETDTDVGREKGAR